MKAIALITGLLLASIAFSQAEDPDSVKMRQPKDIKLSATPVSHAEAKMIFEKAWKSLAVGLKVKGNNPVKLANDVNPISKNEVLGAIRAIVTQVEPMFKRSATPVPFRPERLRKDLDQASCQKRIRQGF